MNKNHHLMLSKYVQLKNYFEVEEGKYDEEEVSVPQHVREALMIIRQPQP